MSDVFKSADWAREALAKKERPKLVPFVFSPSSAYDLDYTETKERVREAFFPPKLYNFKKSTDA